MGNVALVRNLTLTLASLFVVPSCVSVDDDAGGDNDLDTDLAAAEATLTSRICPVETPAELAPPTDQDLAFVLDATGVQRYSCNATATGAAWTFVAPAANLLDNGRIVGAHYAGPTWADADTSTVMAAKVAGATPDPASVPWLLLSATGHGGAAGKMTDVASIQRLVTTAGLAPTVGCDTTRVGAAAEVPYTAKYFFYRVSTKAPAKNVRCGATR
jgi:hypothetical protein